MSNPNLLSHQGICPSSSLRQKNVKEAPKDIDLFLVIGSRKSANTTRLAEIAKESHPQAVVYQVLNLEEVKKLSLSAFKKVALVSGASSSEATLLAIKEYLESLR